MRHEEKAPMKRFTLGTLADWCGSRTELPRTVRRTTAGEIWHDSRQVKKGDVFVALATQRNDGHAFITAAFEAGAAAVIAAGSARFDLQPVYEKRVIRVADPLKAVQRAARTYRRELGILLIGITGSSGKTTTRNFISTVLRQGFLTGETFTNWNNHIGVPLSLLRFSGEEWVGVIEMGANHCGEIGVLSKIAQPDIGVITNIGYAHVGLFGSLARTTEAKFEIADGMNHRSGFLLLNGDDPRLVAMAKSRNVPAQFYGTAARCVVRPENIVVDSRRGVSFTVDGHKYALAMPGRHFVYSALPAIFLGRRCGLDDERIAEALAAVRPSDMRGTLTRRGGVDFLVDCYNANPSSMKSALVYLHDVAAGRRKVAVVGEMLELGRYTGRLHTELGKAVALSGVGQLIAVGPSAGRVLDGARKAGMAARHMEKCDTADAAIPVVKSAACAGDVVLLKGSRGMHLETIFDNFGRQRRPA